MASAKSKASVPYITARSGKCINSGSEGGLFKKSTFPILHGKSSNSILRIFANSTAVLKPQTSFLQDVFQYHIENG